MLKKFIQDGIVFSLIGLLSNFTALIITSLYSLFFQINSLPGIIVGTITEESAKLIFIFCSIHCLLSSPKTTVQLLRLFVFLGIGFALPESLFIFILNNNQVITESFLINAILPAIIHIITSFLTGIGFLISEKFNNKPIWIFNFFIFSLFIHLFYNLTIFFH